MTDMMRANTRFHSLTWLLLATWFVLGMHVAGLNPASWVFQPGTAQSSSVTNNASLVGSVQGNVSVTSSTGDINVTGSSIFGRSP